MNTGLSISAAEITLLDGKWYVNTICGSRIVSGLSHCRGIQVQHVLKLSDIGTNRWAFKATVYKSRTCLGFVDAWRCRPFKCFLPRRRR